MIKTFTILVSYYLANPGPPVMMLMGTNVNKPCVWNFEFGSLGFV
jgi:hypothetical protein